LRDFKDDYQKRKDQQRGSIGVFFVMLAITGVLLFVGMLAGVLDDIGGKFTP